jgi:hypothetical protein
MVNVDMWDSEEGYICQGTDIGFCTLGTAVVAGECVKLGTSVANQIVVSKWAAIGDSIGIAKKGGVTGDVVPVIFYGVVKLVAHITVTVGSCVRNCQTAGTTITWGNVVPIAVNSGGTYDTGLAMNNQTGTAHVLGLALQDGANSGDEILVLIGGAR